MNETSQTSSEPLTYHFRPRMVGSDAVCKLGVEAAEFQIGIRETRIPYPMIQRIRLSYRPTNMSMRRYLMEIWPRGGSKVEVSSVSFLMNFQVIDNTAEYRKFVFALHRKIIEARGECEFAAGFPVWRWWPLTIIGIAAGIAGVLALFYALMSGQFFAAAVIAALGSYFMWQLWAMVTRNLPKTYKPDEIPEYSLPQA